MAAMQTARIPLAILIALELSGTACTPVVSPCLSPPPPEDDTYLGPCLEVAADPDEPELPPCLSPPPPDPPIGPCLEPEPPKDPPIGPCLKVAPPPDKETPVGPCLRVKAPEPPLHPCLSIAPPKGMKPGKPTPPKSEDEGATARADVLDKLADTLPPDVLAKLRGRDA